MTDEPRDRAIGAALALLHQPSADGATEAWQAVGELGRIGVELRSALDPASTVDATTTIEAATTIDQASTVGAGPPAEEWPAAAAQLAERLEEAAAWWTGRSGFPWSTWDEPSAAALGSLLCELDALAAELLTAAGSDAAPQPADAIGADVGFEERRPARHRVFSGRLLPAIGLAAAAVVGVIGGITVAATQVSRAEVPRRSIVSEPVPYTLHDGTSGATPGSGAETAGTGGTGLGDTGLGDTGSGDTAPKGTATVGAAIPHPAAAGNPESAASPTAGGGPAGGSDSVSAPGVTPASQQGSKYPQPRDAGSPPPISARTNAREQFDTMVADVRAQAEALQEEQLRELAERMQAAMGLATGLRTP